MDPPVQRPHVAIVGASAAGLAAAWSAAREGAHVLLLESKAAIGEPPAPASVAFDFLWSFPLRPPEGSLRRRHEGVRVRSPNGARVDVDAPLSILDRRAFDQHLAKEAEKAGARVLTGVEDIQVEADRTVRAAGLAIRPDVLVFADGARSLARRFVPSVRHPDSFAWGASLTLQHPGAAKETRVGLTLGSHARGGRSQLNPLEGDAWSHWTFYTGRAEDAERHARTALALDARLRGWSPDVAKDALFTGVAPDPVYALPGTLAADGLLVTGGAAGQGGLELGLASGEMAGRAAARAALARDTGATRLRAYERAWKRQHLLGYRTLRVVTSALARLADEDLDALLAPWHERRLDIAAVTGLVHDSPARRARVVFDTFAQNPRALPPLARAALKSALPPYAGRTPRPGSSGV